MKFLKAPFTGKQNKQEDESSVLDCSVVCSLVNHFPIGAPVDYYPEYRQEITLDSLVVAYVINRDIVYSATDVKCGAKSGSLVLSDQGIIRTYEKVNRFMIVVPDLGSNRTKLDYIRREELSRIGGLSIGNSITLVGRQDNGQIPVLETVVKKRTRFKDGHYDNQIMALLDVNAESLTLTDQRTHLRLKANVPASVQISKRGEYKIFNCILADFADHSLRIVLGEDFPEDALPRIGGDLVVMFNLPGRSEQVALMGELYRKSAEEAVVMLKGLVRHGQLAELGAIEILGIKASLLQHCQGNAEI